MPLLPKIFMNKGFYFGNIYLYFYSRPRHCQKMSIFKACTVSLLHDLYEC